MDKLQIERVLNEYISTSPMNEVTCNVALDDNVVGMVIYDEPIVGYASADSDYLVGLSKNIDANVPLLPPCDWLQEAASVISFFLPYTERVRKSNHGGELPSIEWLHGRIEGQALINDLLKHVVSTLTKAGFGAVAPILDTHFSAVAAGDHSQEDYRSNWSERHVAYACGLGTFSLSKGLITKRGIAGRFGSVVTTLELEPTSPAYRGLEDNCIMCGACVRRCPVDAISLERGKSHNMCSVWLDDIRENNSPYYGCGKCQVGVPCESRNPSVKR